MNQIIFSNLTDALYTCDLFHIQNHNDTGFLNKCDFVKSNCASSDNIIGLTKLYFFYFNESEMKGNRKYFTFGVGFKLDQKYGFDFAYLVPTGSGSPLANTLRVTLLAAINNDAPKK